MTIKEFAQLCGCSTQTLRYYDRIGLLTPVRVDPWSGYRYYDSTQALDFVKIKNLQAADFSIREIRPLLACPDARIYEAFEIKIAEQAHKLERIRQIQQTYLAEKNTMEKIIYSMTDYLLSHCGHPELLTEFGLTPEDSPELLALLRRYLNAVSRPEVPADQVSMSVNGEIIRGEEAVLNRIQSLTKDNLSDTIFLDDGFGHSVDHSHDPDPEYPYYDCIWERRDWAHIREFIRELPPLESGKTYCLRVQSTLACEDLSFPLFLLAAVLRNQSGEDMAINCACSTEAGENRFRLLRKRDSFISETPTD